MDKAELDQNLEFLYQPDAQIQIIIYAILRGEEHPKKLDIANEDLPAVRNIFLQSIGNLIRAKADHAVLPLSTADERVNSFYQYDLEIPEELNRLQEVIGNDNLQIFDFRNDDFANVESLIILLGNNENQVSIYKRISPVEVVGRSGYLLWKANNRIRRFEDSLLRISPNFQAISVQQTIIILDLSLIEKSFGFTDVIKREAAIGVEAIRGTGILTNIEVLTELIDDITFARKLTKIARSSPVIQKQIPNLNIINFVRSHPATRDKMRLGNNDTQIFLDTKISKNLFVKLLNDDFLTSELTRSYYDSLAKDSIVDDAEQ